MQVRIQLALFINKQWDVNASTIKKLPNKQINFNWVQFYFWTYKFLLNSFNSITNYESFLLTSKVLSSWLHKYNTPHSITTQKINSKPLLHSSRQLNWKYSTKPVYHMTATETTKTFWKKTSQNVDLFLLYLQFSNASQTPNFKIHAYYRPLFLAEATKWSKWSPFLNVTKMYSKWKHSYNLLLNLFFEEAKLLVFSHKILKTETLAFNWSVHLLSFNLFKYSAPYFFLKEFDYGDAATTTFKRLARQNLQIACISDIKYHEKTLFYLKNNGVYTIGFVSYNTSPWAVEYAIPSGSSSLFTQYFFLKLLSYIRQQAKLYKFNQLKTLWYYHSIHS